ncbi:RNA polymerase sigma factor [Dactylosporangium vinaceum]|uniref:RNA polymerase sigma factor n=1 Tax=Dactylosporangium vinaceum TaxID=53362 RepID=A0ABV5LYB9_9ACTN|nr:RNA polymerase sigma factor [Dactylosporangium vinaceum]UAB95815.1 RNA polymerase sigma factor [Dactylosporangium vinaceum]
MTFDVGVDDATAVRDPRHFAVLYDRYAAQLYRYAHRRVGPEPAEDAVAETFLAAFQRRHRYDPGRPSARPWLFGILTRELAHRHRAESARYRALARAGADEVQPGFAERVDAAVSAQALHGPLAGALARLSRGDRDVLLLIAWGDCSHDEVAETLGIRLGTVRSRLHRARKQIRAALGAAGLDRETL